MFGSSFITLAVILVSDVGVFSVFCTHFRNLGVETLRFFYLFDSRRKAAFHTHTRARSDRKRETTLYPYMARLF